jgi:hypothetical protein
MEQIRLKRSVKKGKKKSKKRRFKKIELKLTARQARSLENYCAARKTSPIKLIKKNISKYLNGYEKEVPREFYVSERQLDLFEGP